MLDVGMSCRAVERGRIGLHGRCDPLPGTSIFVLYSAFFSLVVRSPDTASLSCCILCSLFAVLPRTGSWKESAGRNQHKAALRTSYFVVSEKRSTTRARCQGGNNCQRVGTRPTTSQSSPQRRLAKWPVRTSWTAGTSPKPKAKGKSRMVGTGPSPRLACIGA